MRTIKIGRNPDNNIIYNVPIISGNHAVINISDDGQIVFTDHSTNGTWINGNMLRNASAQVTCMDKIIFPGDIVLDWNLIFPAQMQQAYQPQYQAPAQYNQEIQPQQSKSCGNKKMFSSIFSFDGRIRRLEFGLTGLIILFGTSIVEALIILVCVGPSFFAALSGDAFAIFGTASAGLIVAGILSLFVGVVVTWIVLAQRCKRCHDINMSGWFQLLVLVPFIGWIFDVVILFIGGTPGTNQYGENPKL